MIDPSLIQRQMETEERESSQTISATKSMSNEAKRLAIFCLILSLITGVIGCYISYSEAKVVGGDAYNFIIGASRGTAIVGLGVIFGLFGVMCSILHVSNVIAFYSPGDK